MTDNILDKHTITIPNISMKLTLIWYIYESKKAAITTEKYIPGAIKAGSFVCLKAFTLKICELILK